MTFKIALLSLVFVLSTIYQNQAVASPNCRSAAQSTKKTHSYLKENIDPIKMQEPGYQILESQPILSAELAQQLLQLMPKYGTSPSFYNESVREIRFASLTGEGALNLEALPTKFKQPIIAFIKELENELNRNFSETEGSHRFSFGIIRNFSRDDLVNNYHVHQNGFFSATISLLGPGTVVPRNQRDPELRKIEPNISDLIQAHPNQIVLITDGQRARKRNIPSTSHGSPTLKPDEQRLVLLIHFSLIQN